MGVGNACSCVEAVCVYVSMCVEDRVQTWVSYPGVYSTLFFETEFHWDMALLVG